MVKLVITRTFT